MEELDLDILVEIGKLTREIREEVQKIPQVGTKISEIVLFIENTIFERGYMPAFPATVCINEVAAHYTYFDEDIVLKRGDLIKIDFGICHKGFITDNAFTIEIETNKYKLLMQKNLEALNRVLDNIQVGTTMDEIGEMVFDIAQKNGFNTIQNLSGHELKKNSLHDGLHVPNYANGSQKKVAEHMELAIEPFFTQGEPSVKPGRQSNILHLKSDAQIRDPIAKNVLTHIKENYPFLPFSKRWLLEKFDKRKVLYALNLLRRDKIIHEYEILESVDGSFISQFEETVYFNKDKKIILTRL